MAIQTSLNKDLVFSIPTVGKPDPKLPCPLGVDNRTRVIQNAQKGANGWYYSIRRIGKHIGKNPPEELLEDRRVETLFSNVRKKLTLNQRIVEINHCLVEMLNRRKIGLKRDAIVNHFSEVQEICNGFKNRGLGIIPQKCWDTQTRLLQEFCAQSSFNELGPFVETYCGLEEIKIIELACRTLNNDAELSARKLFASEVSKRKWAEAGITEKCKFYSTVLFLLFARIHNLKESWWHPTQPIDKLVEALKESGPLVVIGLFGQDFYKDRPFQVEVVQGKVVLGWNPKTERIPYSDGHTIIVFEANPQTGQVYFIDPLDESDPNHPESQKLYRMSYQNLTDSISNLRGMIWLDKGKPVHALRDRFALQRAEVSLEHIVFLNLEWGKPDPNLPCPVGKKDYRSRVIQKKQKGPTCWYYVVRRLCKHIGKNPPEELREARQGERLFSLVRKQFTIIDFEQQLARVLLDNLKELPGYKKTESEKEQINQHLNELEKLCVEQRQKDTEHLLDRSVFDRQPGLFKEFCNQSSLDTLDLFLKKRYDEQLNAAVRQILGKEAEKTAQTIYASRPFFGDRKWEDLTETEKGSFYHAACFTLLVKHHNLKESKWHPTESINELAEALQKHGPHIVLGLYGRSYYEDKPFVAQTLHGKSILGWKPNAKRKIVPTGHVIEVFGANLKTNCVYFVDPIDDSDPDSQEQKIYTMSYRALCERIITTEGKRRYDNENQKYDHDLNDRFALHA